MALEQHFINPLSLPLSCEISGATHLAQLGLMAGRQAGRLAGRLASWQAGWQAGRQVGRQADEIQVNFEFFSKLAVGLNIKVFALFNQGTASL